jgi:hypothetical protein
VCALVHEVSQKVEGTGVLSCWIPALHHLPKFPLHHSFHSLAYVICWVLCAAGLDSQQWGRKACCAAAAAAAAQAAPNAVAPHAGALAAALQVCVQLSLWVALPKHE